MQVVYLHLNHHFCLHSRYLIKNDAEKYFQKTELTENKIQCVSIFSHFFSC